MGGVYKDDPKRNKMLQEADPDYLAFLMQLRQTRKILGLNQTEMAALLHMNRMEYAAYETARKKIKHYKIWRYALKYILNTRVRRNPLQGLGARIAQMKEEEQDESRDFAKEIEERAARSFSEGSDSTEQLYNSEEQPDDDIQ